MTLHGLESEARRLEGIFDNVVSTLDQYDNVFEIAECFKPRGDFDLEVVVVQVGARPTGRGTATRVELQYWIVNNGREVSGHRKAEKSLSDKEFGGVGSRAGTHIS
jgi:hypothetical protein